MKHVYFRPWVGDNYRSGSIFGKRVLVLGESHYQWDKAIPLTPQLTREAIRKQLSGNYTKQFWTNIAIAFLNKHPELAEKRVFWHSIAFYNFIQHNVGFGPRCRPPSDDMWEHGKIAFREVLMDLKPQFIAVLGYRLWEHLPDFGSRGPLVPGAPYRDAWLYPHGGGHAFAFPIRHPSAGFSGWSWHRYIKKALALAPAP